MKPECVSSGSHAPVLKPRRPGELGEPLLLGTLTGRRESITGKEAGKETHSHIQSEHAVGFIIFPTSLDFSNIPRTIITEARQREWHAGGTQSPVLQAGLGAPVARGRHRAEAARGQGSRPEDGRCGI